MKVDGKEVSALLMSQDQLDSDVKPNGGIAINSDTGGKDKVIKYLKKEFNKGVRLYV